MIFFEKLVLWEDSLPSMVDFLAILAHLRDMGEIRLAPWVGLRFYPHFPLLVKLTTRKKSD